MKNSPQSLIVASADNSTFKIKDSKLEWMVKRCQEVKYSGIQSLKSSFITLGM
jgi:hypothetical protein